ncbi:MAG: tetratricopeptide repeat protein [Candidatus Sabulitectum sp.]|nr:tetratricopeptide repeat protein [Candidatus Sabulitectum sp.]
MVSLTRSRTIILLILVASAVCSSAMAQTPDPVVDPEISIILQRAQTELANLESQIVREEERLARIEAELILLRRQRSILFSAQSAFELGEELYTSGSIVWARDAFISVVENFSDSEYYDAALFRLELIYFELQEYQATVSSFEQLTSASPGFEYADIAVIVGGLAKYHMGEFADSRLTLQQVSPSADNYSLAAYLIAVTYVAEGSIEAAITELQKVIDQAGRNEAGIADRARIAIAQIYVEQGLFDLATDEYLKVSPFSAYYDVAMLGLTWTYMHREEYQDAYNLAERILEEVPGTELYSEFELAMANCALGAQDIDIAISMYRDLMNEYGSTNELYDNLRPGDNVTDQYASERDRLDRIRLGLTELKEEAYMQGDMELVSLIEVEEASLRALFVDISGFEASLSMPVGMNPETMLQEVNRLIASSRASAERLALEIESTQSNADNSGTQADRQDLLELEEDVSRIRLALQDLASKMDSGMAADHDWMQETQYGIAIATFIDRELKRDSLNYLGAYYNARITDSYAEGDSVRANGFIQQRQTETLSLQGRIDESGIECAGYFEEYLARYPESRFTADIYVRLAQLYYEIDKNAYLDRIAASGGDFIPNDYSRTIELYQKVLNQYPGSEVEDIALYSLGYALNEVGDPVGAVASYRRLLSEFPDSPLAPETHLRAGDFFFDSFDFDSAYVFYNNILDYPDAGSTVYQFGIYKLGWTAYLLNDYKRSIALFGYLIRDSHRMDELGLVRRTDMVNEAVEYLAHDFMEQKSGPPVQLATNFLDSFDDEQVTVDVLTQMGDFYIEQGFWIESVEAYQSLLQRDPYSADAPFIQSRIAVAYEGAGDLLNAARAREEIVEMYGPESEWVTLSGDSSVFAEVDSLRGSAMEYSIQYHAQQVAEGDPQLAVQNYTNLIEMIELYLLEYPDSRQTYDFRYLLGDSYYNTGNLSKAGDVYLQVVYDSTSTQQRENAAVNAFSSFGQAYDKPGADSLYLREKMHEIGMYYADRYPSGEYAAQFLFNDAGSHYNASDFTTARVSYMRVYNEFPNSEYTARSARFLASAFEADNMFSDAEYWYERAADAAAITGEDLGADVAALAAAVSYMDAEALAQSEDTESLLIAAARYEESALSHPGTEVAPVALYDAGETYGKAGDISNAIRVFSLLASTYPETTQAPEGLMRAAYLAMESEHYILAGDTYLNAYNRFPDAEGVNSALYSAAVTYEKGGATGLAMGVYNRIITEQTATPQTMVIALGKYGDYLYDSNDFYGARETYQQCVDTYDMYREGPANDAARSAFRIGEIVRVNYDAMFVTLENVQQKAQLKSEVESWYGQSLTYNVDVWFMASCVRAGELYEDFANTVAFMDPPADLTGAAVDEFYNQLYVQFYEPEMQKAINIYVTAVEKAVSADVVNHWVDKAAENLELLAPGTVATLGLPGYDIEVYEPEPEPVLVEGAGESEEETGQ